MKVTFESVFRSSELGGGARLVFLNSKNTFVDFNQFNLKIV